MALLKCVIAKLEIHFSISHGLGSSYFSIVAHFFKALYKSVVAANFSHSNNKDPEGLVLSQSARVCMSAALRASARRTTIACSGENIDTDAHDSMTLSAIAMFVSVA